VIRVTNHINSTHRTFRLAASHYLNSAPLIWSFLDGSKRNLVSLIDAVPARCADLLATSQVDSALVPVIEYHRIPNISLIPDVCVGSKNEVLSVVLVSKQSELKNVRSVALDESSRTSAALVKIIFREFVGTEPAWLTRSPDLTAMLELHDAALMIGDPAMTFPRKGVTVWDLAGLWHRYTGLGFVFAMWMVRNEAAEQAKQIDFAAARSEGVAHIQDIVDDFQSRIPLSRDQLVSYLTDSISYDLDDQLSGGLNLYFQLAQKHGLVENVTQPVFVR
jgi:chorismate dehydratase